jgi:lipopolysaccharide export LptBFGC system permease protein LptF
MYIIQRYLIRKICSYSSWLTLLFLVIATFILLGQTISQGALGLSPADLFRIGWYQLPMSFLLIMPFAWLLGHLMSWRDVIQHSELVAIYSMGMGRLKLICLLLPMSLFLSVVMLFISCWVAPTSSIKLQQLLNTNIQDKLIDNISPGQFLRVDSKGQELYIYTEKRQGRLLKNVFVASRKNSKTPWDLMWAKQAGTPKDEQRWFKFEEGIYYELDFKKPQFKTIQFKEHGLSIEQIEMDKKKRPLMFESTYNLLKTLTPQVLIELNWRLFFPISCALLMVWSVIALPVMSTSRDNQRIVSVGILGYVIFCVNFMFVQLVISRLHLDYLGILAVPYALSIMACYCLYYVRRSP